MKFKKPTINGLLLASLVVPAISVGAVMDAEVNFAPGADANYTVEHINEFDWQSSGDLVIENDLPESASANGTDYSTFSDWITNAVVGDSVKYRAYAHARMNDMLVNEGGSVAPTTLSKDGSTCDAGSDCFEVTAALDLLETAVLISTSPNTLLFQTVSGNYSFFLDSTPDSDVGTGAGFKDGTAFLQGEFNTVGGTFQQGGGGNSVLRNTVTAQVTDIIAVDKVGTWRLVETTFDTLISQPSTLDARVSVNGKIGLNEYIVKAADLVLKADSNTEFFAEEEQVLGACRMTGGGVDESGTIVDGTDAEGQDGNRTTFAGQIGAPSATQPQPFGHWTHHQQKGPAGSFSFHAGTASAPPETKVTKVSCFDEGFCNPARPAYFKQLDWEGIGAFANVKGPLDGIVIPQSNKDNHTLHCIKVHYEDIGEPGPGGKQPKSTTCNHTPRTLISEGSDCTNCPDIYQVQIYEAADCDDPENQVIYSWGWPDGGFIRTGNIQIHPEVGQQPPK